MDDLERGALVALLRLPGMGPWRLRAVCEAHGGAVPAWEAIAAGRLGDVALRRNGEGRRELLESWQRAARPSPESVLDAHRDAGVAVVVPGDPAWPAALDDDPEPPAVLFVAGDVTRLGCGGVAVVGTRRCTAAGAAVARSLGEGLARAGVPVVSGLALGIDGAAHLGHLRGGGRPLGVVGSGLDVVYPPRHDRLWIDVSDHGALVSEAPLGAPPERWRFPARNRLIAALSEGVVVVESGRRGGSMSTVDAAEARQRPVLAVPGSVLVAQSEGTNQLIFDGCPPVRDVDDVLGALDLRTPLPPVVDDDLPGDAQAQPGGDDPIAASVLAVLGDAPTCLDGLLDLLDHPAGVLVTALARLEASGSVVRGADGYRRARS